MNISEHAKEVIKRKMDEFNAIRTVKVTEDEMLELMVLEFDVSTKKEKDAVIEEKESRRAEYIGKTQFPGEKGVVDLMMQTWDDGWRAGWWQFQYRKASSKRLKREE